MDIELNRDTHDLDIENGDFRLTPTEQLSIRQKLIIKLSTFKGEWFLDDQLGIPYYEAVLGKGRSQATIDAIFKRAILETEGVKGIVSFQSNITKQREYVMRFTARTVEDDVLEVIDLDDIMV